MLTFYYSKGSSALAAHILLEEVGADYVATEVPIARGAHLEPAFLAINPKGRLPALKVPKGVLTENPAILEYLAATHPEAGMLPQDLFAQARARAFCAYLCATVHVAFAHMRRADRWAEGIDAQEAMRARAPANLRDCADMVEAHLLVGPWAMGGSYSYCDPYLFLMGRWLGMAGVCLDPWSRLAAHRAAMLERPAVQRALAAHGLG